MVKQLQEPRWNKHECLALLNTLFPPAIEGTPNDSICKNSMHKYRAVFYRYIQETEAIGPSCMTKFIYQLSHPGTGHTWPEVRADIDRYLELADLMIEQANAVANPEAGGVKFFLGHEDDSLSARIVSNVASESSERSTTISSATTSIDEVTVKRVSSVDDETNRLDLTDDRRKSIQSVSQRPYSVNTTMPEANRKSSSTYRSRESVVEKDSHLINPRTSFHSFSRPCTPVIEARRMRSHTSSGGSATNGIQPTSSSSTATSSLQSYSQVDLCQVPTATSSFDPTPTRSKSAGGEERPSKNAKRKKSFSLFRKKTSSPEPLEAMETVERYRSEGSKISGRSRPPLKLSTTTSSTDHLPNSKDESRAKSPSIKSHFGFTRKSPEVRQFIDNMSMFLDDDDDIPPLPTGLGLISASNFSAIFKPTPKLAAESFPAPPKKNTSDKDLRKVKSQTNLNNTSTVKDLPEEMGKRTSRSFSNSQSPGLRHLDSNAVMTSANISEPFPFYKQTSKSTTALPSRQFTGDPDKDLLPSPPKFYHACKDLDRFSWTKEDSKEFRLMEHSRKWAIANARSGKLGLRRPDGEPGIDIFEQARGSSFDVPETPALNMKLLNSLPLASTKIFQKKSTGKTPKLLTTTPQLSIEQKPKKTSKVEKKESLKFTPDPRIANESFGRTPNLNTTPSLASEDNVSELKRKQSLKFVPDPRFANERFTMTPDLSKTPALPSENKASQHKNELRWKEPLKFVPDPKFANENFGRTPDLSTTPLLISENKEVLMFAPDPKFANENFGRTPILSTAPVLESTNQISQVKRKQPLKFVPDPKFANENFGRTPSLAKSPQIATKNEGFDKKRKEKLVFVTNPKFANESFVGLRGRHEVQSYDNKSSSTPTATSTDSGRMSMGRGEDMPNVPAVSFGGRSVPRAYASADESFESNSETRRYTPNMGRQNTQETLNESFAAFSFDRNTPRNSNENFFKPTAITYSRAMGVSTPKSSMESFEASPPRTTNP